MDIGPCLSSSGKPKKRWATPQAAQFVAQENLRMGRKAIYWYACEGCGRWHTTHVADTAKSRKKRRYRRNVDARIAQESDNKNPQRAEMLISVT